MRVQVGEVSGPQAQGLPQNDEALRAQSSMAPKARRAPGTAASEVPWPAQAEPAQAGTSQTAPPLQLAEVPEAEVIRRRAQRVEAWRTFGGAAAKLLVFVAAAWALFTWVFGLQVVQGDGMEPASGDGDVALTWRLAGSLEADDIVVWRNESNELLLGRVVAQPGDTVEVTDDGDFLLNGAVQPSPTGEDTEPADSGPTYPLTLGEGEYFVLGDNRASAVDSRAVGAIGINDVEGKVIALLRLRGI